MTNKNEILRDYMQLSVEMDFVLEIMEEVEQKGRDISPYEARINKLNKKLADMEDNNPWITKVLIAMEGA